MLQAKFMKEFAGGCNVTAELQSLRGSDQSKEPNKSGNLAWCCACKPLPIGYKILVLS